MDQAAWSSVTIEMRLEGGDSAPRTSAATKNVSSVTTNRCEGVSMTRSFGRSLDRRMNPRAGPSRREWDAAYQTARIRTLRSRAHLVVGVVALRPLRPRRGGGLGPGGRRAGSRGRSPHHV